MKTTIYYFSGTGNSLKIARDIAEKLEECELVPIAKVWQQDQLASTSEKVGFIFPLYYFGLPKIVYDFINNIELAKSNYFFAVITRAGDVDGAPLQQLDNILETKTKTLNAGFFIRMPNNFIIGYKTDSEAVQKEFFENAINQVEKITNILKENGESFQNKTIISERMNKKFRDKVYASDKSFYANENCTNCGICESVCPVNNIVLTEGLPQWQHKCQQCLACINFCPEKAIQFGTKSLETGRYHHPEITIQEIMNQKK
ncbi:MAG: 4Fe-4S ferredoxin [Promethearchaeota archaeon Loki_b31]|nr:MAG: 4Fe-4S ferredoxin [Candidatus Lokiarchaeota archaeon Loki_b31]